MNCPKCDAELKCPECGGPLGWPRAASDGRGLVRALLWTALGVVGVLLAGAWLYYRAYSLLRIEQELTPIALLLGLPLAFALGVAGHLNASANSGRRSIAAEMVVVLFICAVIAALLFPLFAKCR